MINSQRLRPSHRFYRDARRSERLSESLVFNVYRGIPVAIFRETAMQAAINSVAQSQLFLGETAGYRCAAHHAAITARLGGMPRIDSSNLDTGTFCLVFKYLEKLRPACIVGGFGKIQRTNHAFDVQIFVGDFAEASDQIKSCFVVKVFPLVGNVLVELRESFHGFSTVRPALFLPSDGALKPSELLLRLAIVLGRPGFFSAGSDEERLQAKINSDFRIFRRKNLRIFQFAGEDDEPAIGLLSEGDCLDCALDFPMKFEFNVSDALKPGFSDRCAAHRALVDGELYRVEPSMALEPRVSGFLSVFQTTKECLESAVKAFAFLFVESLSLFKSGVVKARCNSRSESIFSACSFVGYARNLYALFICFYTTSQRGNPERKAGVFLGRTAQVRGADTVCCTPVAPCRQSLRQTVPCV